MKVQVWTKEPPTKPGDYWACSKAMRFRQTPVLVRLWRKGYVHVWGRKRRHRTEQFLYWCGPIEAPPLPKEEGTT